MDTKEIILKVSGLTAHIKGSLTYGESQGIQASLLSHAKSSIDPKTKKHSTEFDGAAAIEWAYTKMQKMVLKCVNADGVDVMVTRKFLEDLPLKDGELLEKEVDLMMEEIKKK